METHFIEQIRATKDPSSTLMILFAEDMITGDEFDWIYTEIFEDQNHNRKKERHEKLSFQTNQTKSYHKPGLHRSSAPKRSSTVSYGRD